ncbi:DUF4365 domain-containing protein [Rhodococcus rhodnii]|uniref:DUF4365 domain-containing protein n=2 Tax=Rhodococcus rhodnii TaxID=38312 RepID=R7WHY4_9NOCA|nr:DUF4365 domain-containing protein [Rhodococcus rhodnii]EOM74722.1 hypothetical protein Rrhod_3964 [Rhodococcus rhodnii LMG 5362]TXG91482.1 DUF4365 domain-containing protein [Rhodococcus rhodnii]
MAKRASKTDQTGNIGEAAVRYQFFKLGWHVADNPPGEVGTDLLLQARADGLLDLGAPVGAQVKSGPTWFDEPKRDANGEPIGWWFRDSSGEHIKYWLDYHLPHILVLHEQNTETSYWVHITPDKVQSTGVGMKILVPRESTVDEDHADELLEVAISRAGSRWEGSAWNGGAGVTSTDRLRYALLTPRLIAPHPNRAVEEASAHEAIALLVKMRLHDLQPSGLPGSKSPVPDLESCKSSPEWQWRLYAALYGVLIDGQDSDELQELVDTAPTPHEIAAASVISCVMHMEDQDARAGLETIERALTDTEKYAPVDRDWLLLHKARCLSELGNLDQARSIAATVQRLRTLEPNDPTAMAIAGAGADIIFTATGWGSDLSEVISGRDTIAAWWRTQEISSGLQDHFDEHFRTWANHATTPGQTEGDTWYRLRAATLLSGMAADHSAWRHSSALLAKHILTFASTESSTDTISGALTVLRRAGDTKTIKLAAKRLLDSGPAAAVRDAATTMNLDDATRTSLHADLALLAAAADVLENATADRACRWILSNLVDIDGFINRFQPTFSPDHTLIETLSFLVPALSADATRELITYLLAVPSQEDVGLGHDLARVLRRIPPAAWSEDDRAELSARDDVDSELRQAVTAIVVTDDSDRRDQLRAGIREGNLDDLAAFGDITDLDTDTVEALCAYLEKRIDEQITALQNGRHSIYTYDFASILVLVNVWHPEQARWEPVRRFLTAPTPMWVAHLENVLTRLRRLGGSIPDDVAATLVDPLHCLMLTGVVRTLPMIGSRDVRGAAGAALAAINPDVISDTELWDLMEGATREQREAAIRVIAARGIDGAFDTLWAMSRDSNPWMRAHVANQLAIAADRHEHDDRFSTLLQRLLADPGTLIARMVAVTLPGQPRSAASDHVANILRNHLSAEVRRYVAKYEAGSGAPIAE